MTPEQADRKRAYNREYMRERKRRGILPKNGSKHERLFCDCGNAATIMFDGDRICDRCYQIDRQRH